MMRRPPRSTPLPHHAALPISAALFARRGFEQTSVQAIADAVGLSKAGLLHHFPSKDALRAAVLAQVDTLGRTALKKWGDSPAGPPANNGGARVLSATPWATPGLGPPSSRPAPQAPPGAGAP